MPIYTRRSTETEFLSTLSLRRATFDSGNMVPAEKNFYPRSPCGERHCNKIFMGWIFNFYPRSPCGERRPFRDLRARAINFYPRSPCGERLPKDGPARVSLIISIHALLAESDKEKRTPVRSIQAFLSTLSLRRATAITGIRLHVAMISIHALLAESDCSGICRHRMDCSISIHALLAESDFCKIAYIEPDGLFLSTLSLRRATVHRQGMLPMYYYFYPRSPCGERQFILPRRLFRMYISIHALLAESDSYSTSHQSVPF